VLVCALGALAASLARLVVHYALFSGQMLRLRWTGAAVVPEALQAPGWLGVRFGSEAPSDMVLHWALLLGLLAQLGCLALALRAYRAAKRAQVAGEAPAHSGARPIPLAWVALAAGVLALGAALAPALWGIERAYWLVRVMVAEHQPDLTVARRESVLRESLTYALHVSTLGAGSLALQLVVQLATGVLAGLAIAIARGARLARVLERLGRAAEAQGWRQLPAPTLRAVASAGALLGVGCVLPVVAALVHSARLRDAVEVGLTTNVAYVFSEIDRARAWLETSAAVSSWLIAAATALALVWLVVVPERARNRRAAVEPTPAPEQPRGSLATLGVAPGLAALAALLLRAAAPYAAENGAPLAADPRGVVTLPRDSPASSLVGPDRVELAPILELIPGEARLDDRAIHEIALPGELSVLERRWSELHPGHTIVRRLSVLCGVGTPLHELTPLLRAAAEARYTRVQLVFGAWRVVNRPVLGWVREPHFSAAEAELVLQPQDAAARSESEPSIATIDLAAIDSCDTLGAELVAHRRGGRKVRLQSRAAPTTRP